MEEAAETEVERLSEPRRERRSLVVGIRALNISVSPVSPVSASDKSFSRRENPQRACLEERKKKHKVSRRS